MAKKNRYTRFRYKVIDAFDFSKAEQRGIIVLIILLLLLFFIRFAVVYFQKNPTFSEAENADIESFIKRQQDYSDSMRTAYQNRFAQENWYGKKGKQIFTPFEFCPDTMKLNDWIRLGFSEKQASQITNYQSKGGRFFKKEDFQKMYCVSEETYCVLEPYIRISAAEKAYEKWENPNPAPKYTHKLELNEADSIDLLKVPWIGESVASQIITYRTKLGGFIHIDQLKEVFLIDDERFTKIEPYLYVNAASITKINVNEATISMLVSHPYIDYYLAKTIVNQRNKTGKYASLSEMKKVLFIYDELYQKITPYLTVE